MKLTNFSIHHYVAVLVFCVGLLVMGIYSYVAMPREAFPDVKVPYVFVTTVLDGANPTDVEISVTIPLETELDGVEGMKEMRSMSAEGFSNIVVEFHPDVEVQTALQRVRDAVDIGKAELPAEADEPVVREFSFTSIPVMIYHLVGTGQVSRSELYELAEKLQDELKTIAGVLDVDIIGGRDRQVLIEVDPDRLHHYNLSLSQVQAVLRGTNRNVSAGTSRNDSMRIVMRVPGEFRDPADIFTLAVGTTPTGTPIFVRDVATVRFDFEDEESRARVYDFTAEDGNHSRDAYVPPANAVSLHVKKRSGENILRIAQEAQQMLADYPLPADVQVIKALDFSKNVNMMIDDLENGVLTSLILILAVIFIGMGGRNAVLVALAVPFSMLMSFIALKALGLTLNMIVLFSLIMALGMLVDNAIVIVENIYRHHSLGMPRVKAARIGTQEVAWPVITSTATTVGAFVPLLFWPGIMGQFMGYLPQTVIVVLLCSLFVALVINPTLSALIMRRPHDLAHEDPEFARPDYALVRGYQKLLEFMLRRPFWTIATALIMLVLTVQAYKVFGAGVEFFPDTDPERVTCSIRPPEGTSLEQSDALCAELEKRIFGAPGSVYTKPVQNLKHASISVGLEGVGGGGGGFMDDNNLGPITINVEFVDRDYRTQPSPDTLTVMRQRVEGLDERGRQVTFPLYGADYDVVRPEEGPPQGKPLSVDVYGQDLGRMTTVVRDMKALMANTEGAAKPTDNASTAQPTLEWTVERDRAGMVGLDQATVASVIQMAVGGLRVGTFGHGDDEQDILLRMPPEYRRDTGRLKNVQVPTPAGGSTPLTTIAHAELVPGPVTINHYNRKRVVNASAEVQPTVRADATVRAAFQQAAMAYPWPAGITYRFGGAAEEQDKAQSFLTKAFVSAVFIIVLILVLQFNSVLKTGIVMTSVILSLMGVFMGLLVVQAPFGIIMTGLGVISLAGVVVNNAIVLLDAIGSFEKRGLSTYDAIVTASMIRFRPVLLTAITTILGLVPMALKMNVDFKNLRLQFDTDTAQFWQSMALAIIFGLLVATVLTLGVVPTLYLIVGRYLAFMRRYFGFGRTADQIAEVEAEMNGKGKG